MGKASATTSPQTGPSQRSVLNLVRTSVGTAMLQSRFSNMFSGLAAGWDMAGE